MQAQHGIEALRDSFRVRHVLGGAEQRRDLSRNEAGLGGRLGGPLRVSARDEGGVEGLVLSMLGPSRRDAESSEGIRGHGAE